MSDLVKLAASLPKAEPVHVPYETYVEVVREALVHGDCELCAVCDEPRWYDHEKRAFYHRSCFAASVYYDREVKF